MSCRGRRPDDPLTRQRHRKSIYSSVSCKTLSACGLPPVPPAAAAVRRVAAPYKMNRQKIPHKPQADDIFPTRLIYISRHNFCGRTKFTPCGIPLAAALYLSICPPLSRTAHKNPARQRRGQDSVLPKPGAGSLSVASGEIYFIDYVLAREVAAQVFETYVPYLSLGRRVVTEAAP